jgi:hypothetical protein
MLASISPVGEASRHQRWSITISAYAFASAVGGALLGGLLGGVGSLLGVATLPAAWLLAAIAVVSVIGAAIDAGWLAIPLPSWRRQVDERWLTTYRGWVYGAGYGLQLGIAVVTIITSAVTYAALLAALLVGSVPAGATIGLTFGIVRAVPLLLTARVRTPQRLQRLHAGIATAARPVERATVGAQLAAAMVAGTLAMTVGA